MEKLRWGILSTARICRRLLPALRDATRSEVRAVASRDPGRAESFAREWEIPTSHGSYEALLADPTIDAVYVPLPNRLHGEWSVKACQAGKHVLCEKPLAVSVAEVDRMYSAARDNHVTLIEGFQFRFHPQMKIVRELIESGRLGRPTLVKGCFSFQISDTANIRLRSEPGAGSLWDIGCYPLSFIQGVLEEDPVQVFGWSILGETGVDVVFAGQQKHSSGAFGQFECSFVSPYRVGAEIICENGSLILREAWRAGIAGNSGITLVDAAGRSSLLEIPDMDPFLCEVEALEAAALDGVPPVLTHSHSRGLAASVCAYLRSAESGRPEAPETSLKRLPSREKP